jgi:ParB family transcriptional regulator, chromosome partitioning protein
MQIIELNPQDILVVDTGIREEIGDVSGLAATIADQGMLQPLGVIARADGHYQLIYGHRRRSAAISLGLTHVPCLLFVDDDRHLVRQLTENLQRRDLNDLEQANAFARVREEFRLSQPDADEGVLDDLVAHIVGLSPRSVRRYLGLLDLDDAIQAYLSSGQLTVTQAQHLRRISNAQTRLELARAAVDEGMSAAELSRLASFFAANPDQHLNDAVHVLKQASGSAYGEDPSDTGTNNAPISAVHDSDAGHMSQHASHDTFDESPHAAPGVRQRQQRIKSLDQLVSDTDRLFRAYTDGQLQQLIDTDTTAAPKIAQVIAQLRQIVVGLTDIARSEQWPIDAE